MSTSLSDGACKLLAKLETRLKGKPGIVSWNCGTDSMLAELTCNGWTVPDAERAARELQRAGVLVIVKTGHFWMMDLHNLDVLTFDVPSDSENAKPPDPIRLSVAASECNVSTTTLKRAIDAGNLESYRRADAPKNSPHLVDRNAVIARYGRRVRPL